MASEGRSVYCGNCGSIAQAGDLFCGVCGARVLPDAEAASPTQEIPTLVPPPPMPSGRRRNRGLINGVMVGAILVLSLVGVGALALTGLGPGLAGRPGTMPPRPHRAVSVPDPEGKDPPRPLLSRRNPPGCPMRR